MKKRYVIIGLLASSLAFGQRQEIKYTKKKLLRTEVQALLSYYTQDNNHSAVTGGIGTEDLQVYAQDYSFTWSRDSVKGVNLEFGADIISSASTDNIDDVVSSASKKDFRIFTALGHYRNLGNRRSIGFTASSSLESDYLSFGLSAYLTRQSADLSREWQVKLQTYFDDLRWRNPGEPRILIYPEELRYREWFDEYRRNSYNLSYSLYQTINRRMAIGFYPGIAYQHGLLSTPFHRVYFSDDSERVENLPMSRIKIPIGTQLNMFLGGIWIVRAYYRFYWDDFGITAHTINLETPAKLSKVVTVSPFVRLYTQTKTDYFRPYAQHELSQRYYTSDYDLSAFNSYTAGMSVRYAPFSRELRNWSFGEIEFRYARYQRSDGLLAHTLSTFIDFNVQRHAKERKPSPGLMPGNGRWP